MTENIQKIKKKRRQRWMLLAVGDRGSVLRVPRIKTVLIAFFSITLLMIAAVSFLGFSAKGLSSEKTALKRRAAELLKTNLRLKQENEILNARISILEAKNLGESAVSEEYTATLAGQELIASVVETDPDAPLRESDSNEPKDVTKAPGPLPEILSVEDLAVTATEGKVHFRFILKKVSEQPGPVSGYAFVVLMDPEKNEPKPFVIPSASFRSGKPYPADRGQFFSIRHFKKMAFEEVEIPAVSDYKAVAVIILDKDARPIFEKSYPFDADGM